MDRTNTESGDSYQISFYDVGIRGKISPFAAHKDRVYFDVESPLDEGSVIVLNQDELKELIVKLQSLVKE